MEMQAIVVLLTLGGTILTVVGLSWKVSKDLRDASEKTRDDVAKICSELRTSVDDKIDSIYARLREHDKAVDCKYMTREMCNVLHGSLEKTMEAVNKEVKTALRRSQGDG